MKQKYAWELNAIYDVKFNNNEFQLFVEDLRNELSISLKAFQTMSIPVCEEDIELILSNIYLFGDLKAKVEEADGFSMCLFREDTTIKENEEIRNTCLNLQGELQLLLIEIDRIIMGMTENIYTQTIKKSNVKLKPFILWRKKSLKNKLSPEIEGFIEKYPIKSNKSWSLLRQKLISKIHININPGPPEEKMDISGKQALYMMFTSHPSTNVRTSLYTGFEESVSKNLDLFAHALNQIVKTNTDLLGLRGYENILSETLQENKLTEPIIDSMCNTLNN